MKVALLAPYYHCSWRGNAVTVRRIERSLNAIGVGVKVFSQENLSPDDIAEGIRSFAPDILHAFHAIHCGGLALRLAEENRIPFIVTFTGTDIYAFIEGNTDGSILRQAAALVFFSVPVRDRLTRSRPDLALSTHLVPQGVDLPQVCPEEPAETTRFTFFLPAGVRGVKNLLFPFAPLAELYTFCPRIRLDLAGGVIEAGYAAELEAAVKRYPFATWRGEVNFERMSDLYRAAHVVLNCSYTEGGMANSLLEGMAHGRPVLASDIEGNRALVRDGVNGFLFRGERDFLAKAELLLSDKGMRKRMGLAGRQFVSKYCSPSVEAERYLNLYYSAVAAYDGP